MRQSKRITRSVSGWLFCGVLAAGTLSNAVAATLALSLAEAERLAQGHDPAVAARLARSEALTEAAVADGQLPDPKLKFGLFNLPVNDFDIEDQPTTQFRVGVQQAFPRGDTLRFKQRQASSQALAEQSLANDAERKLIQGVRERFLEVYYQVRAGEVIDESRELFAQLVDITESHYASGRVSQQDVLRAELELARLDDRATRIRNAEDVNRAELSRWIDTAAHRAIDAHFPRLPDIPDRATLNAGLDQHPMIAAESARVDAANQAVGIARAQYKPGWNVGVEYRKRFGDDPDGSNRDDMMAVMATVDLPLFTENRQDKRLAAGLMEVNAATLTRDDRMRDLKTMLDREYANWQRLGERQALYEEKLLRDAHGTAEASLLAYQSGVTEFTTLMRARITELDVRLDKLRVRVDRAKARARLLYLAAGDKP